jgi:hypothetical protein
MLPITEALAPMTTMSARVMFPSSRPSIRMVPSVARSPRTNIWASSTEYPAGAGASGVEPFREKDSFMGISEREAGG